MNLDGGFAFAQPIQTYNENAIKPSKIGKKATRRGNDKNFTHALLFANCVNLSSVSYSHVDHETIIFALKKTCAAICIIFTQVDSELPFSVCGWVGVCVVEQGSRKRM